MLNNLNLKFLIKAHTKIGLFALFFFYISAFFGTITLFMPQIHTWENPSRYFAQEKEYTYKLDALIKRTIKEEGFSTELIEITLPSYKDNVISINDPTSRTKYINPYTLKMLDTTSDHSFLSKFFNDIHVGRNIPKIGILLMGISSILIIFLTLSGIILYFNKHKKNKINFNFKWHKDLSIILLPYILAFSLTGAVLGFMLGNASPFAYTASKTQTLNMRALVGPTLFPKDSIPKKEESFENLKNIDTLIEKAKTLYPTLEVQTIKLLQWNNKNAKIKISGYENDNRILTGRINRVHIFLNPITAEEISRHNLENTHIGNKILSGFYFLHFIPDETLVLRLIYLVLSIAFLFSLALGFLIWSDKQASKYKDNPNYYNFLSRFSISIMFGIIPSTALILLLYWAIPSDLFQRIIWLKGIFYSFWAFSLLLSIYYDDVLDLLKGLAFLTSIFLFSTIIAHIMVAKTFISFLVKQGSMHTIFYVDLVLLILSISFFLFYKYAHKIKLFAKYSRRYYGS